MRVQFHWPIRISRASRYSAPINGVLTPNQSGAQPRRQSLGSRLTDVENLTRGILLVTVVALIGVIVATAGVVSDQWRFNQDLYREKTDQAVKGADDAQQKVINLNTKIDQLTSQLQDAQAKQAK